MNTTADTTITISDLEAIDSGAMPNTLTVRIDGTDQSVLVRYWGDEYQIGVVDADGKHVTAPGFSVPSGPEARVEWGTELHKGAVSDHITLIPAAISWIGYGGQYQTQAAPGAVAAAAQVAEQIAAAVSDPAGHRAQCAISDAEQTIQQLRDDRAAAEARRRGVIDAAWAWAGDTLGADADTSTIRARVSLGEPKRNGSNTLDVTLMTIMEDGCGWLGDSTTIVSVQLKPGGRWNTIVDRNAGYSYA